MAGKDAIPLSLNPEPLTLNPTVHANLDSYARTHARTHARTQAHSHANTHSRTHARTSASWGRFANQFRQQRSKSHVERRMGELFWEVLVEKKIRGGEWTSTIVAWCDTTLVFPLLKS
jgi:hypothetical protein